MKKILLSYCLVFFGISGVFSQTSDDQYKKPLKDVLTEIETKFNVKLKYKEEDIKDRWVTYAEWRFRPDLEKTLTNVLAAQDMEYVKLPSGTYKIKFYNYANRSVEDAKEQLDYFLTLYNNVSTWEKRKDELRDCMYKALKLSPLPPKPAHDPIITKKRVMNGYSVENIAIETLPGVYVCGSLYRPLKAKGKIPVILCPNGHFEHGRYRPDQQYRCATLARMGAMAISYDLFAWGESLLQFDAEDHHRSLAQAMQALNSIRILDYLLSRPDADSARAAITGGSGGGSQTLLITALDNRIKVSVPVVMVSSHFFGGCACESGLPIHLCGDGTNNAEISAMAAPRPQLIISDGQDWTSTVPELEFPYIKKIYGFYGDSTRVENAHFGNEGHDYGLSKRLAMYSFMAKYLGLNIDAVKDKSGNIDESKVTIEDEPSMYVFGKNGENLPKDAIHGFAELEKVFGR